MILYLTMLHGSSVQKIIQLHGQNCRSSSLIGGGFRSQPEMHIPAKLLVFWVLYSLVKENSKEVYYYNIHIWNYPNSENYKIFKKFFI